MELERLRQRVFDAIDNYVYPYSGSELGRPKNKEWIAGQLDQMRAALVSPYWTTVGDKPCIIVADDKRNHCLAFSPTAGEYFLLERKGEQLVDVQVYGDAVGCFMAR